MDINDGGLLRLVLGESTSVKAFNTAYFLLILAVAILSFLLGSIRPSILLTKKKRNTQGRASSDKPLNFSGTVRAFGAKTAILGLLGDFLCCAASLLLGGLSVGFMYIGGLSFGDGCYVASLFCLFGFAFPVFHGFNGGKAIFPIAVSCLVLAPIPFAISVFFYFAILLISKYEALAAVSVGVLYPILVNGNVKVLAQFFAGLREPGLAAVATILSAVLVVYFYLENLNRISSQSEPKFDFSAWKAQFRNQNAKEKSDEANESDR